MEEVVEEQERIITVNIYDAHASNANFKVKPSTTAADICKIILSKRDILSSESRFFSIVLVVTAFNSLKKNETHCLRTLKPNETLFETHRTIAEKMVSKYGFGGENKLENAGRWFFKDMRTSPIDLGANAEISGEYESDEDEEISQSDLSYLAKSERKGYLLKRSNTDFNLWRRWYCVLMDQLWCVDMSREKPRAKCVKLSGMIRYRDGYKTLDQLQIIIINSSDSKSHFFRAFNLIDQKKWIQDLNIKTRVAADNDSFAMAEVMITDEEDAKNFRVARQLGDVLDQAKTMEALAFRRAVELNTHTNASSTNQSICSPNPSLLAKITADSYSNSKTRSRSSSAASSTESSQTPRSGSVNTSSTTAGAGASTPVVKPNINDIISPVPSQLPRDEESASPISFAGRHGSLTECTNFSHPRCCSWLSLDTLSICDRVEGHYLVHELHRDSRIVTEIMLFIVDVHKYKEKLRRDLYISIVKQQQAAKYVYLKHILPQLQMANLDAYPDFSHEMMQLGGLSLGGEELSTNSSNKIMPSSPSRVLTSLSSKSAFSPTSGTAGSSNSSSSSGKLRMRSEYASRLRSRNSASQNLTTGSTATASTIAADVATSSAFAAINWALDVEVLMRVHRALFEIHAHAIEVQNGYVTQDPLLLVKYAAGTSKFRTKDRSVSTASTTSTAGASSSLALQVPTQQTATTSSSSSSGSFWPWWGGGSSAPSNGTSSQGTSAAASPVPTSHKCAGSPTSSSESGEVVVGIAAVGDASAASAGIAVPKAVPAGVSSVCANSAEGQGIKSPPQELFDEVVAALICKLN